MKEILFVCTLNISRSAMAEIIVNELYGKDYHASSAGLYTCEPKPMCYDARAALMRAGYDAALMEGKASSRLTEEQLMKSDIVVGVTAEHAEAARDRFPSYRDKIITFPISIHAPSAGDEAGYDRCFENLCEGIERLLYPEGLKWTLRSEK